jgi:hypothetical protein
MDNTAAFGRLIGWISIVLGLAALVIGALITSPEGALAEFERCTTQQRLGIRHAPCPPPAASGDKVLLIAAGAGSIASGVFFLLLAGILTTLLAIQADQREARRTALAGTPPSARPAVPLFPPAPPRGPQLPTRFAMQQRYGEQLGNRAWHFMDKGAREGAPLSEPDAVQAARSEMRAGQG